MKAPYERDAMLFPKNSAATLQQAIRRRLGTTKQMRPLHDARYCAGHGCRPERFIRH